MGPTRSRRSEDGPEDHRKRYPKFPVCKRNAEDRSGDLLPPETKVRVRTRGTLAAKSLPSEVGSRRRGAFLRRRALKSVLWPTPPLPPSQPDPGNQKSEVRIWRQNFRAIRLPVRSQGRHGSRTGGHFPAGSGIRNPLPPALPVRLKKPQVGSREPHAGSETGSESSRVPELPALKRKSNPRNATAQSSPSSIGRRESGPGDLPPCEAAVGPGGLSAWKSDPAAPLHLRRKSEVRPREAPASQSLPHSQPGGGSRIREAPPIRSRKPVPATLFPDPGAPVLIGKFEVGPGYLCAQGGSRLRPKPEHESAEPSLLKAPPPIGRPKPEVSEKELPRARSQRSGLETSLRQVLHIQSRKPSLPRSRLSEPEAEAGDSNPPLEIGNQARGLLRTQSSLSGTGGRIWRPQPSTGGNRKSDPGVPSGAFRPELRVESRKSDPRTPFRQRWKWKVHHPQGSPPGVGSRIGGPLLHRRQEPKAGSRKAETHKSK